VADSLRDEMVEGLLFRGLRALQAVRDERTSTPRAPPTPLPCFRPVGAIGAVGAIVQGYLAHETQPPPLGRRARDPPDAGFRLPYVFPADAGFLTECAGAGAVLRQDSLSLYCTFLAPVSAFVLYNQCQHWKSVAFPRRLLPATPLLTKGFRAGCAGAGAVRDERYTSSPGHGARAVLQSAEWASQPVKRKRFVPWKL